MAFNDRLKEARRKKGLTQEQLGELIGVAKTTITGYEKGNSDPGITKIYKLITALEVDANYLWQDEMSLKQEAHLISNEEMEIIEKFRQLDQRGQTAVVSTLFREYDYCNNNIELSYVARGGGVGKLLIPQDIGEDMLTTLQELKDSGDNPTSHL